MAATHLESSDENAFWDAVGGTFVAALNDGLSRARHSASRSRRGARFPSQTTESTHPFAAAVMRAFDAALPAALATADEETTALQTALRRQAWELLVPHLELTDRPMPSPAYGARLSPLPRHEHLVVTLLMECAALVLSEHPELAGTDGRPAALIRALGHRARCGRTGS